ncbi:MAG: HAD family hydrolase [Acidimicrobiales bacterium]|nr:HAD family hydrolase [Acidimicrobiales bacterium]
MMRELPPITAVTYDYWNTLIGETTASITRRKNLWTEVLLDAGYEVSEGHLDKAFSTGWQFFDKRWRENTQTRLQEVVSQAIKELPFEIAPKLYSTLEDAYLEASRITPRSLLPEVEQTLTKLKEKKVLIGVICDVGTIPSSLLEKWLMELGVHAAFDFFGFSDRINVYKPHPQIFKKTLEALKVQDPSTAAHIGDLKRTDVAGARTAGMKTVRYIGSRIDEEEGEEADYVSDSHLDIIQYLGLNE